MVLMHPGAYDDSEGADPSTCCADGLVRELAVRADRRRHRPRRAARSGGPGGWLRVGRAVHPPGGPPRPGDHRRGRRSGRNPARAREGCPCSERRSGPGQSSSWRTSPGCHSMTRRSTSSSAPSRCITGNDKAGRTRGDLAGAPARVAGADLGHPSWVLPVPPAVARPARRGRGGAARAAETSGTWAWPFGLTFFRRLELARPLEPASLEPHGTADVPRPFAQVDVFTHSPTAGNPRRRRPRRRRADHGGDAAVRALDEPVRDDVRASRRRRRRRLPRADLHAGRRAAVRRAPDARHLPRLARRPAARRTRANGSCRSAPPGWSPCAGRRTGWRSRRRR